MPLTDSSLPKPPVITRLQQYRMRLLYFDDGELSLTNDLLNDGDIPPYAILSHTWGKEEVLFEEMINKKGKDKTGYAKILFCAQQAAADGIQYCWVDSCCINKSNSAELTEAINSMFRWYQNSERCYVFLTDVSRSAPADSAIDSGCSPDKTIESSREWISSFRNSRWFTRGWTLQELIAPRIVDFYSKEKDHIGSKNSLEQELVDITGIPTSALQNQPLRNFSIDQRFAWASSRHTTYEEDMAYCLLGVFDINMPLLYGEGKQNAMARLTKMAEHARDGPSGALLQQKLSGLRQWLGVPDPSTVPQRAIKARSQDTHWIIENAEYIAWKSTSASFLWLEGMPGSGKTFASTTILEDLLQHCDHRNFGGVCAHFYFELEKCDTELMLRSFICQLTKYCTQMPESLNALFALRDSEGGPPSLSLLLEVLRQMILDFPTVFILIEGLDECVRLQELVNVLEALHKWRLPNLHLVTLGRAEMPLRSIYGDCGGEHNCVFVNLVGSQQYDTRNYIRHKLSRDTNFRKWANNPKLQEEISQNLTISSSGSFRWVACQIDILAKCHSEATLRETLQTLPRDLHSSYDMIFSILKERSEYAMRIIEWLAYTTRTLSVDEISEILGFDLVHDTTVERDQYLEESLTILEAFPSIVAFSNPEPKTISLAHSTVQYYIRQNMQDISHAIIANICLKYLLELPEAATYEVLQTFKLARYCAESWYIHAYEEHEGEYSENTNRIAIELLSIENPAYLTWLRLHDPDSPVMTPNYSKTIDMVAPPLYYAALFGLLVTVETLLSRGADINAHGGLYRSALGAATAKGHEDVVDLLLRNGADNHA